MNIIVNENPQLLVTLIRGLIDLLKFHPHSVAQQSPAIFHAALLVHRIVGWHPPCADILYPLIMELLLTVPGHVEMVSAALKAILLVPTIVDQQLLDKLTPWIEMIYKAIVEGTMKSIDPLLFTSIQQIVTIYYPVETTTITANMMSLIEWASWNPEQQRWNSFMKCLEDSNERILLTKELRDSRALLVALTRKIDELAGDLHVVQLAHMATVSVPPSNDSSSLSFDCAMNLNDHIRELVKKRGSSPAHLELISSGKLEGLAQALQYCIVNATAEEKLKLAGNIAKMLSQFTRYASDAVKDKLVAVPGLLAATSSLWKDTLSRIQPDILVAICYVAFYLSKLDHYGVRVRAMVKAGWTDILVKCLQVQVNDFKIVNHASWAIHNWLCVSPDDCKLPLIGAGAEAALWAAVMKHPATNSSLANQCMWALQIMSFKKQYNYRNY
mmetsp:Transcript_2832/g.3942  ORF Transcript_2832/g.3942 Transcript_2832/m.3942 type:complete len:442 (+) Transcript_2832:416-1741(+)